MKKYGVFMILMAVLFTCASAIADDGNIDGVGDMLPDGRTADPQMGRSLSPQIYRVDAGERYNPRLLHSAYYLSDNDIWFFVLKGKVGGYLIQTDIRANVLNMAEVPVVSGYDMEVLGIAKVNGQYLIGARDSSTLRGVITCLSDGKNKPRLYQLDSDIAVLKMIPSPDGMLVLGIKNEKNNPVLYLLMINDRFDVVCSNAVFYGGPSADSAYLLNSSAMAADDNIYIQVDCGVPDRLQPEHLFICFDRYGLEKWRIRLPDQLSIQSLSTADDHVYLYGLTGDLNQNDVLVNHKATILCYSSDGKQEWQKIYESASMFYDGASNGDGCVAISGLDGDGTLHIYSTDSEGRTEKIAYIEMLNTNVRGLGITSDGVAVVLGHNDKELFVFTN
ncbi:MAG: hypothetical protein Q4G52_09730 [Clostridia bacterium]|nr:hypothetical protein [Clostridia bacterium]